MDELVKRAYNNSQNLYFEAILSHLKRKGDTNSFYDFMEQYFNRPPEKLEINTLKKYRIALTRLKKFKSQVYFSDIDNLFIRDFHQLMQTALRLEGAACKKYMEAFKKVIRHARRNNYMDAADLEFLFDDIKIKVPKPKRTFLEPQEIMMLKNIVFPQGKNFLESDRDIFLFQIYTAYY